MDYRPLRSTAPPTSILSAEFRYVDSAHTNIRERFEKIRRDQAQAMVVNFKRKTP